MTLHRLYIEDVFDVISEIQHLSSKNKFGDKISNLRRNAVRTVANRELESQRFLNIDSAEKSIHDGCSRRLKPAILKISDLTDPVEQKKRFLAEQAIRQKNGHSLYPLLEKFLSALNDLPDCAGIAVGIDRFIRIFTDLDTIDDVVAFTPEDLAED